MWINFNMVEMSQYIKLFNNKGRRYVIKKPYISVGRAVKWYSMHDRFELKTSQVALFLPVTLRVKYEAYGGQFT
jgi:hypothetical protein